MHSTPPSARWRDPRSSSSRPRGASASAGATEADEVTDAELLREVMNTVGRKRCAR